MRIMQKKPASPEPSKRIVPGSGVFTGGRGTGVPPPGGTVKPPPKPVPVPPVPPVPVVPLSRLVQPMETVLVSMVTAAVWANARPHSSVAPVSSVIFVKARIFPSNDVAIQACSRTGIDYVDD
jgi:hypothetical protein